MRSKGEPVVDQTPDPIDVTSESLVLDYADDGGVRQWALTNYNDPKSSQDVWVPVHPAINAALNAAGFRVVPIVDDATRREGPGLTPEWLTRMAIACRNVQEQAQPKNVEWFDWVPERLDRAAAYLGRND